MIMLIMIAMLFMGLRPQREDKLELKEIGLWLKNNGFANSIIVGRANVMRLAFYADSEFIPIPKGSCEDTIRFAKQRKANLLVIDQGMMDQWSVKSLDQITCEDLKPITMAGIKASKDSVMVLQVSNKM
jgi:hypothetical protein